MRQWGRTVFQIKDQPYLERSRWHPSVTLIFNYLFCFGKFLCWAIRLYNLRFHDAKPFHLHYRYPHNHLQHFHHQWWIIRKIFHCCIQRSTLINTQNFLCIRKCFKFRYNIWTGPLWAFRRLVICNVVAIKIVVDCLHRMPKLFTLEWWNTIKELALKAIFNCRRGYVCK